MSYEQYKVTFEADGVGSVSVMLDETPAAIVSGYGGWTVVNRMRRTGLTVWEGKDPIRLPVPVLFDGVADGLSQEIPISRLSRMALPPTTGGEPPTVTFKAAGLPSPGPKLWVIENLQWGSNKVYWDFATNGVMSRLRQDCVVNLLEYRAPDRAAFKSLQPGKTSSGPSRSGWPKIYVAKLHDNGRKIAQKVYGDASKWKLIRLPNGQPVRDPSVEYQAGSKLRCLAP